MIGPWVGGSRGVPGQGGHVSDVVQTDDVLGRIMERLAFLEDENQRLAAEVEDLKGRPSTSGATPSPGGGLRPPDDSEPQTALSTQGVSRRGLLRLGGAAAAGAGLAGAG